MEKAVASDLSGDFKRIMVSLINVSSALAVIIQMHREEDNQWSHMQAECTVVLIHS